jgi:hypothetical protein
MNQGYVYFIRGLAVQGTSRPSGRASRLKKSAISAPYDRVSLSKIFMRRAVSAGDDSAAWFGK